ncbi:MAG: PQQ-binding-like beta-propeller repeat protein [Verrucomicrobiales bacterium]
MKPILLVLLAGLGAGFAAPDSPSAPVQSFTAGRDSVDSTWPAYRGPSGDGTTTEKIPQRWPIGGPKAVWRTAVTNGFSSFCVADGKAFTLSARNIDGIPSEIVIALDAATGKEAWAFLMKQAKYEGGGDDGASGNAGGDGPRSTPTWVNGKLYVMGANLDLYCLNAADGHEVWKHDLAAEFHGRNISWKSAASPLHDGGLIFVAGGGPGEALIAFHADSGTVAWKAHDDTMTHATPVPATIHGVRQIIFFTKEGLIAVAAKTGALLWRYAFPFRVSTAASPVVSEDLVYCAAGYGVGMGCVKVKKSGAGFEAEELWRKEGDKVTNHWSTPVCKDGFLYGMFSFKKYAHGPLSCLELKTGEVKWSQAGYGPGNVILAGGETVIALSDKGELVLVAAAPNSYKELARADILDGKCWSTPVLAAGRIYARSTKEAVCVSVGK